MVYDLAMKLDDTPEGFIQAIFSYPTLSEAAPDIDEYIVEYPTHLPKAHEQS
jgi:hypothetical protein